ncbi:hypothetical protein B0J14DRAFT_306172 [Halenospora varia]|nr:hypothetical protein B0J14DRAFT_306172 [Halenospora varia]
MRTSETHSDQTLLGRVNCSQRLILGIKRTITQNWQRTLQPATSLAAAGDPSSSDDCWLMSAAAQKTHSAILGRECACSGSGEVTYRRRVSSFPARQSCFEVERAQACVRERLARCRIRQRPQDFAALPQKLQLSSEVCWTLQHRQTAVQRPVGCSWGHQNESSSSHSAPAFHLHHQHASNCEPCKQACTEPLREVSAQTPEFPSAARPLAPGNIAAESRARHRRPKHSRSRALRPRPSFPKSTFPPASALFLFNYSSMLFPFHSFPRTRSDQSLTQPVCFSGPQEPRNVERGTVPSVVTVTVRQRLQFTRPPRVHCISGSVGCLLGSSHPRQP